MIIKVYYDTSRNDTLTTTATVNERNQVTAIEQQRVNTIVVVDDGGVSGLVQPTLQAVTVASGDASVPIVGATYTIDGQAGFICTQTMPKRTSESPFVAEVQCTYTRKFTIQPDGANKWAITVSIDGQRSTQPAYQDKDGTDVINKAGDAYDPSLTETIYDEKISISYQTLTDDSATFATLRGMVNSGSVTLAAAGFNRTYSTRQLLVDNISSSSTVTLGDGTTPVFSIKVDLIARQDTWIDNVLEQGFQQLVGGKLIGMYGALGNPTSASAPIDAAGKQLAVGAGRIYTAWKIEHEASLSGIFTGLT